MIFLGVLVGLVCAALGAFLYEMIWCPKGTICPNPAKHIVEVPAFYDPPPPSAIETVKRCRRCKEEVEPGWYANSMLRTWWFCHRCPPPPPPPTETWMPEQRGYLTSDR